MRRLVGLPPIEEHKMECNMQQGTAIFSPLCKLLVYVCAFTFDMKKGTLMLQLEVIIPNRKILCT